MLQMQPKNFKPIFQVSCSNWHIININTRWRWQVTFPLSTDICPGRLSPYYTLHRRHEMYESWFECGGKQKICCLIWGFVPSPKAVLSNNAHCSNIRDAMAQMDVFPWAFYICSIAVKVTILLILSATETTISLLLAVAVLCHTARWEAFWTFVLLAGVAVLYTAVFLFCVFGFFQKCWSNQLFDSFDTELFISEIQQLLVIWDSRSSSYSNMKEKTYAWVALCNKFIENYFSFYKFSCATM